MMRINRCHRLNAGMILGQLRLARMSAIGQKRTLKGISNLVAIRYLGRNIWLKPRRASQDLAGFVCRSRENRGNCTGVT